MSKTGQYWAPRGPSRFTSCRKGMHTDQVNRRYRNCRRDNRDRSSHTTATTMVDTIKTKLAS